MNIKNIKNGFAFIIDTDSYTGSFDKELCVWVTGVFGDTEIGSPNPDYIYEEEIDELIMQACNEKGECYPVECIRSPRSSKYNSLAIFFTRKPSMALIKKLKIRTIEFCKNAKSFYGRPSTIQVKGFRGVQVITRTVFNDIEI